MSARISLPSRPRLVAALSIAAAVAVGGVAVLAVDSVDPPARVGVTADRRAAPLGDVVVTFDVGDLDAAVVEGSLRAAYSVGGLAAPGRTGSVGMRRLTRAGATVHAPPSGYLIPTVYLALPEAAVAGVMGPEVSGRLGADTVVMGEITAGLTGARVGDVIELTAADGSPRAFTIAGIEPDAEIGESELVMTLDAVERLGATADTRMVIWGFADRGALDAALVRYGITGRRDTRVSRSWDPASPDSTLSTAETKRLLGEPWYRLGSDGSVTMHPDWVASNLTPGRILLDSTIRVRAQCHVRIVDDLKAALGAVAAAGLAAEIDVANANAYGGCFVPRFTRTSGQIGFLSRHSYGQAFDTNTQSNCQGCTPRMHCDVVRIFRRHGFAWGGNFRSPDGMHFEWVGERRDTIQYPSPYCPNLGAARAEAAPADAVGGDVFALGEVEPVGDHTHGP